ncbi:dATP pyrophosphohydrolase [Pseudoalteromonas luteoviolacea B = ATCC 29581]|nr:dATP pyrophosphohydrolase [Pseudoalteromonas luteoviolacea B = ATCC 29581]
MRKPFSVLVVIHNSRGEFLLMQRADDPNFWQSVTGGIDEGETPQQTAIRELKEETGIDCEALSLNLISYSHTNHYAIREQWLYRYEPGTTNNTEYVFSVEVPNDIIIELNPREHLNFVWLPWQDAAQKAWSPSNQNEITSLGKQMSEAPESSHSGIYHR